MIRHSAVAGLFYPADPTQLHKEVDFYLKETLPDAKVPKAMIVPHAGFQYSGPIAASAYARLKTAHDKIKRVVLIGPSHRVSFQGLAISQADTFATPLGNIQVDMDALETIRNLPFVHVIEQAHTQEHCLEVQLPFLQEILRDFKIVPIVAGNATPEEVGNVINALWGGDETLIVISSDLSHYHEYATARKLDYRNSQFIEGLQYERLDFDSACGRVPISGLLKTIKDKALTIKTIDLRNSGDTAGDKNRVVGYGAYVVN